eukprot:gnl/Ergobibamus_cyprinoides/220.p1 GENE.gnl/Ergobibamus_cyprinoides/220~~gnl/Ergobibamus_cyprinoides/220.p1  ORF type:complete len:161 (+),score=67.66 gnl/Ergobibamus_cyprinoides/220:596-1078(+)
MIESHPEMKAVEVTDALTAAIEASPKTGVTYFRCNYANPDMVGHTGNIQSVVRALECLDAQMGRLFASLEKVGGTAIITADHGNAEEMKDKKGQVKTSHTTNLVPCWIVAPGATQLPYKMVCANASEEMGLGISSVTATFMNMLGYEKPEMYRPSLIQFE